MEFCVAAFHTKMHLLYITMEQRRLLKIGGLKRRNTFYSSLVYNFARFVSLSTVLCTRKPANIHPLMYLDCKQTPWMNAHCTHTLTICRCNNSYRAIPLWHLINVSGYIHVFFSRIPNEFSVHELLWFTLRLALPSVSFNFREVYTRARLNVAINILSGARVRHYTMAIQYFLHRSWSSTSSSPQQSNCL